MIAFRGEKNRYIVSPLKGIMQVFYYLILELIKMREKIGVSLIKDKIILI